jgi:BirA family biotin operon repressor/biotin-[acetyl-CoA-carboxylase] ligase
VESGEGRASVLWADVQTGGRGRRGRPWQSPKDNLYCTILEPLTGDLPTQLQEAGRRSYLYGLAIARAANSFMPAPIAQVKWPNDVLVNRRKLAGVLLETAECPETKQRFLITGFGVNVVTAPEGVMYLTTTLAENGATCTAGELLTAVLGELKALDQLYRFEGFAAIRAQWCALACGIGERVRVTLPNELQMEGYFRDLDENGALVLECGDRQHRITTGDVFFGPATDAPAFQAAE